MLENIDSSLILQALILTGLALLAIYVYFKAAYTYWKKRGVPTLNPRVPFGNFGDSLLLDPSFKVTEYYRELEGQKYGGLYTFNRPILLLRDPELIKQVMVKDFGRFHSRGFEGNVDIEPLDGHLFALSGSKWRNLRVKLTPTFTSGKMKMMFPTMVETGKELQKYLETPAGKQEVVEIKDVLARYSTNIIASAAFGIKCNCLEDANDEFRIWGRKIFEPTFKARFVEMIDFLIPPLNKILKINAFPKDVSKYFRGMVKDTIEYRESNNIQRKDFMQLMIQLKNKTLGIGEEDPLLKMPIEELNGINGLKSTAPFEVTMDVIAAQAFVFFAAGFETSSTTMTFCLYELARNPDIQTRLRKEIDSVLEKHNGEITYEAVLEMEYLDKVVNETLRMYPPVPLLTRECTQTTKLQDTDLVIEKGVQIMLPVMGLQHDPKYFPNPEKFDPERFNEEEVKKRPQFAYLPFGEGPRLCIGMRFGLLQTKVGLISVLSNNEVHVSEKTQIPLVFDYKSFVLSAEGGMWLKIIKRSDKMAAK